MKNKNLSGSLFTLLAKNYLLFTFTLLAIAGAVFLLWDASLSKLYQSSDWSALLSDQALSTGDYPKLERHLLGAGDAFAVYDETGRLCYATASDFDRYCTPEELACISPYGDLTFVDVYDLQGQRGNAQYLLIRNTYQDGTATSVDTMALDAEYQVVFGGFEDGRTSYTENEFQYLSGRRFQGNRLTRAQADSPQGEVTILLREKFFNDADYYRRYRASWKIWLLVIPLYLVGAGIFIWWLRRKIGRPLQRLNDAVVSQSQGKLARVGDCGGTWEIRQIGESFDRFSDRLAESEAERRRLDQGRQKLIADISHDLKTPITVIAGYIDAICDGKIPPQEQERYLRAIQAKAENLTELVNAFHEYSKVEHPAFVLHTEPTDLCELLRAYLARKYDEIDLAGFTLQIDIPQRPVLCDLDQLQFRRVLDNLLSNALRHNRLGTVLFFDISAGAGNALLKIGDNGEGIPPDRVKHIFEPFVVGSDARSGGGSGLGLSITRRIVEKHGGTIALSPRPEPGRSTEFIISLPLSKEKQRQYSDNT